MNDFCRGMVAGEARRNWWQADAETPALPVLAMRGARGDGPIVLVTGGVHGDEYEGPAAVHRLFAETDPARLSGWLVGLPVAHSGAWEARERANPADGVNLNRVFPDGRGVSGAVGRLASAVFDNFVLRCDALFDLHSGGAALDHLPLIGWYRGPDTLGVRLRAEELARNFGGGCHPWILPDVPGVLTYEAQRAGKIAVGAEWRGGGRLDPAGTEAYARGIRRALVTLEMLPPEEGEAVAPDSRAPISGDYQETPVGGLFLPAVRLGDRVTEGGALGILRDALGGTAAEVRAAWGGTVAGLPHRALLHPGDRVAYIG